MPRYTVRYQNTDPDAGGRPAPEYSGKDAGKALRALLKLDDLDTVQVDGAHLGRHVYFARRCAVGTIASIAADAAGAARAAYDGVGCNAVYIYRLDRHSRVAVLVGRADWPPNGEVVPAGADDHFAPAVLRHTGGVPAAYLC